MDIPTNNFFTSHFMIHAFGLAIAIIVVITDNNSNKMPYSYPCYRSANSNFEKNIQPQCNCGSQHYYSAAIAWIEVNCRGYTMRVLSKIFVFLYMPGLSLLAC